MVLVNVMSLLKCFVAVCSVTDGNLVRKKPAWFVGKIAVKMLLGN